MTKFNKYTKWTFNFHILWQTRKIETLFKLKDKNIHPSHVIYIGTCTCNQAYIGETARNLEVRVNEHSDINKQSEPAKHLKKHLEHKFAWDIWHIVKHGLDWICKTRTGFVKHRFVKHGFVKRGFVKHGFVKHGFVKHGFVKGGLSFFVKNDCLTVYLFISVCPF